MAERRGNMGGMTTMFVADLHLERAKPELTEIFVRFLRGPARTARAVYLLGDVFEVWLGDDDASELNVRIAQEVSAVAHSGVQVFFQHGNRDFLLGSRYARLAGMSLLPEQVIHTVGGIPTLIAHGDAWCTDDEAFQRFRKKSRSPEWQQKILRTPLLFRRALSAYARWKSKRHNASNMEMQMGDVAPAAIEAAFEASGVKRIIHGHTHRPALHAANGRERVVIADWRDHGEALVVDERGAISRMVLR